MPVLVSIIIPHFNISGLLENLLFSIPNTKEIQTIVVDDHSSVFHLKKINQLKEKYNFDFYQNQKTKNAGTSRNIGLEKAQGKWILFADSDDYFMDGFYDSVRKYFDSQNDIVFFRSTSVLNDSLKVADRHLHSKKIIDMYLLDMSKKSELFLRYKSISPCARLYRKEFIHNNQINFDEVLYGNDVMFSTKAGFFVKNYEVSSDIVYCITRRYGSLTSNLTEDVFNKRVSIYLLHYKFLTKRLPKKELEILKLDVTFCGFLLTSLMRYGPQNTFELIKYLKKEKITLFKINYLSPIFLLRMISQQSKDQLRLRKYNKYHLR